METNIKEIFIKTTEWPEAQLSSNIWAEVTKRINRVARIKSWSFFAFGLCSFAGLIISVESLISGLARLGFFEYFSLLFSDSNLIISYWKEYTMTLADSVPFASLGASMFLLFALSVSVKKTYYSFKNKLLTI